MSPGEGSARLGDDGLGRLAVRGAGRMLSGQALRLLIQLASVAILSRLLSAEDYGLLAMVMVVVGFGEVFRDFGLSTAAIRAPELNRSQRDALFFLNSAIGLALAALLVLFAPLVAIWFGQPQLVAMSRALSLVFVLNGLAAQYRADLTRHMRFRQLVVSDLSGMGGGLLVGIGMALLGTGYWALVAQQLSIGMITLVVAVIQCRWLPRWPARGTELKGLVRFGLGLSASQVVGYLTNNVDTIVVGTQLGASSLGYYNRGYQILTRTVNQVRGPSTSVALPVLKELANDDHRFGAYLVKGQAALGYTLLAGLAFVAAAAQPIVGVLLGSGWSAVVPVVAWLAVGAMFDTTAYVGYWVYLARGLTDKLFWYNLVALAIRIVCVVTGSQWGIAGVAAGIAAANAVSWPMSLWWLSRLTDLPVRALYVGAMKILVVCALVAAGSAGALTLVPGLGDGLRFLVAIGGAAVGYGLVLLLAPPIRAGWLELVVSVRRSLWRAKSTRAVG